VYIAKPFSAASPTLICHLVVNAQLSLASPQLLKFGATKISSFDYSVQGYVPPLAGIRGGNRYNDVA
jgi:hypothetical protein